MSSPQEINEYLTSESKAKNNNKSIHSGNHNANASSSHADASDSGSHHEPLVRKTSHKSKHSNHRSDEPYDYEMQDYRGSNGHSSSARPTTSYIPKYAIDGTFPIQEVVANSQMAIASGSDPNSRSHNNLRPRGSTTVSANVLNVGEFYNESRNNNDVTSNHNNITSNRSAYGSNFENMNNGGNEGFNGNRPNADVIDENEDDDNEPLNVPMMVKPKTLYQNPQTPTVLPSTYHPINKWSSVKHSFLKEFLAEFIGTLIMILLGTAACCQVNLGAKIQQNGFAKALESIPNLSAADENTVAIVASLQNIITSTGSGTFDELPIGWAAAVVIGYFAAGGSAVSGAHLNPAITVANFFFRGFPAKKLPFYLVGQLLGAFVGALITFILYKKVIMQAYDEWWTVEAVGANFYTNPKSYLSPARQFTSEFITTAVFQAGIFALTDPYTCLSSEVYPLMLFILIYVLNCAMSYQTACAINGARDLGPRLAMAAVGFERDILWERHHHYFWIPLVAPFIGSLAGALFYDICIYQGHESPVNWPLAVYKEMLWKAWFRRPGWKRRNRGRATSDLSDFSFENDDINEDEYISGELSSTEKKDADGGALKKTKSRTRTKIKSNNKKPGQEDENDGQKTVSFKSVQRGKRGVGGIPTILEEDDSIETTSIAGDSASESILLSSDESSNLPTFTSNDEKRAV